MVVPLLKPSDIKEIYDVLHKEIHSAKVSQLASVESLYKEPAVKEILKLSQGQRLFNFFSVSN